MMVSRGEIWLANLNPTKKNNEMGKVRPVLNYQNDELKQRKESLRLFSNTLNKLYKKY